MPSRKSLRERITLLQPTYTTDSYGQRKPTGHQPVAVGVPACWEHTGGTEMLRGRQIEASVVGMFEIRSPGIEITPDMQIQHLSGNNKIYDIHSARPSESKYDGGFRHMEIYVKALAGG